MKSSVLVTDTVPRFQQTASAVQRCNHWIPGTCDHQRTDLMKVPSCLLITERSTRAHLSDGEFQTIPGQRKGRTIGAIELTEISPHYMGMT
jgi:hypothetical protein